MITSETTTRIGIMYLEVHAGDVTNHGEDVMPRWCHRGDAGLWCHMRKAQPVRRQIEGADLMSEEIQ